MRLSGKTVMVTGAAGTIGSEIARRIGLEGGRLVLVDLPGAALEELATELRAGGATVRHAYADASEVAQIREVIESGSDPATEVVDALVCVAGYWRIVDFVESQPEDWIEMYRANLQTAMAPARAVLPSMLANGFGAIVNIASTAGEYGSIRPSAAYAAAKGGVIAFTKSLAREVSPRGVRVNCVSPGPINTPMLRAATAAAQREASARTLVGHLGEPADIAAAVVYLASDEASYVTGEVLRVNGGSLL